MFYSIHPQATVKDPQIEQGDWADFCQALTRTPFALAPKGPARLSCPCFSVCRRNGPLKGTNVEEIYAYVWDLDSEGARVHELLAQLPSYYAYETMSSTPDKPRWRVITALSKPVAAGEWASFWLTTNRMYGALNDPAVKDPTRLYYAPHLGANTLRLDGPPIDVDEVCAAATPTEALGEEVYPIRSIDFLALAAKLQARRDPRSNAIGAAIQQLVAGASYAEPGERDHMCFHIIAALLKAHPHLDIEQCAQVFDPVHSAWGDPPSKVREKLARLQRKALGMPDANTLLLTDRSDHVIAGRVALDLRPCAMINGQISTYADGVWRVTPVEKLYEAVAKYVGAFVVATMSPFTLDDNKFRGVLSTLRNLLREGPAPVPGICFRNGFVTIDDRQLHPHSPDWGARHKVQMDFSPDASWEAWGEVLDAVFPDQPQAALALGEFVGACMAGIATRFDKAFVLLGPGGLNGKSTVLSVIRSMFDPRGVTSIPPQRWQKEYYLVKLFEASVNLLGELPKARVVNTDTIKQVISGDLTSARAPYGQVIDAQPLCGHIFAANYLFETEPDAALFRRIMILPFEATFSGTTSREEIVARVTGPGLYNWALEGLARLLAQKAYTVPEGHPKALESWREDTDPVAEWLRLETVPGEATSDDLYRSFEVWLRRERDELPMSKRAFARALPFKRRSSGGKSLYPVQVAR